MARFDACRQQGLSTPLVAWTPTPLEAEEETTTRKNVEIARLVALSRSDEEEGTDVSAWPFWAEDEEPTSAANVPVPTESGVVPACHDAVAPAIPPVPRIPTLALVLDDVELAPDVHRHPTFIARRPEIVWERNVELERVARERDAEIERPAPRDDQPEVEPIAVAGRGLRRRVSGAVASSVLALVALLLLTIIGTKPSLLMARIARPAVVFEPHRIANPSARIREAISERPVVAVAVHKRRPLRPVARAAAASPRDEGIIRVSPF